MVLPLLVTLDFSDMLAFSVGFCSRMLPCPVGDGNWANLKSVEADSRLLWRSSKLTEGRKSKEVVVSPKSFEDEGSFRRSENNVWELAGAVLIIGALENVRLGEGGCDKFVGS